MHLPWREVAPGNGPAISTSLTEAETAQLQALAIDADVLEIGTAYGYSTVAMALFAKRVTAIDPHYVHGSYGATLANLGAYEVADRVRVMRATSQDILPFLGRAEAGYDLIFIDGDHTAAGVEFDLTYAFQLVRPGGWVAVHDVLETCCCPDVGPTLDRFLRARERNPESRLYELVDTMAVVDA